MIRKKLVGFFRYFRLRNIYKVHCHPPKIYKKFQYYHKSANINKITTIDTASILYPAGIARYIGNNIGDNMIAKRTYIKATIQAQHNKNKIGKKMILRMILRVYRNFAIPFVDLCFFFYATDK